MHEIQRTRLIMLAAAGVLLGAGVYGLVWYQDHKAQDVDLEPLTAHVNLPIRKKLPTGSVQPALVQVKPGIAPAATITTAAPGTAMPVAKLPPVAASNPVNAAPAAKLPPVALATKPVSAAPAAKLPPVALATKPVSAAPTAKLPPVALAAKPVQQLRPQVQPPALVPHLLAARVPTTAPSTPVNPAATPPSTPAAAPIATTPPAGLTVPATTLEKAITEAKQGSGRQDPMTPLMTLLPFPRSKAGAAAANTTFVPPPPPSLLDKSENSSKGPKGLGVVGKIKEKLVPPPPPTEAAATGDSGLGSILPIEQLPLPPSRPIIGDQMKIIAVLDDKAVISFPSSLRQKNKWPKFMTLGSGQQFESITLVSISKDGVTIEEDGERSLKPIPNVK